LSDTETAMSTPASHRRTRDATGRPTEPRRPLDRCSLCDRRRRPGVSDAPVFPFFVPSASLPVTTPWGFQSLYRWPSDFGFSFCLMPASTRRRLGGEGGKAWLSFLITHSRGRRGRPRTGARVGGEESRRFPGGDIAWEGIYREELHPKTMGRIWFSAGSGMGAPTR